MVWSSRRASSGIGMGPPPELAAHAMAGAYPLAVAGLVTEIQPRRAPQPAVTGSAALKRRLGTPGERTLFVGKDRQCGDNLVDRARIAQAVEVFEQLEGAGPLAIDAGAAE